MGLFDKKFCDICGDKVNLLTQKKLSDGQLCSDCKQKLGSFTSGWKQRTVQDVKAHLEQSNFLMRSGPAILLYSSFSTTVALTTDTLIMSPMPA